MLIILIALLYSKKLQSIQPKRSVGKEEEIVMVEVYKLL